MKERRDLYVGLPVNTTHLLVDDIARQPRLDVAMEATVLAGSSTTLSIAGLEEFEVPPTIELESAPDWVSLETGEESGPKLTLLPPRVDEDSVVSMGLRAHLPGVPGSGSRQRITIEVLAVPEISDIRVRRRGRRLTLFGSNFDPRDSHVTIDGVAGKRVRDVRRFRAEDGDATRLRLRVPFSRSDRGGTHTVRVYDPRIDAWSEPADYTVE
ncbi:MAG: hypothetical protein ACYTG4_16425 [Planctomycetota bacterium]|jgi:hypothetical protein